MKFDFAVPCLFGLEGLLASELEELGAGNIEAENGRVFFTGDENTLARVNINSRFGERLQIHIGSFSAHNFEELFQGVRSLDWAFWLDKEPSESCLCVYIFVSYVYGLYRENISQ